jgi:hypothetical protein
MPVPAVGAGLDPVVAGGVGTMGAGVRDGVGPVVMGGVGTMGAGVFGRGVPCSYVQQNPFELQKYVGLPGFVHLYPGG